MTREEFWHRWECEICGGGPSQELTQCDECRRWVCPACLVEREDTFGQWIECNECHKEE